METIAKLLEKEQNLLTMVSQNRATSRKLLSKNRHFREELTLVRKKIVDDVVAKMETGKSLYQVVKEALGKIDGRYNKIYDLINKK